MQRSDSIAALAAALAKAQALIEAAHKTRTNPHLKARYADLQSCWDACREQLTSHGLSVVQAPFDTGDRQSVGVETTLLHASGEWISERFSIPVNKADAQGVGSAITYARRYALCAMVGITPDDDDGSAASNAPAKRQQPEPPNALLRGAEDVARRGTEAYKMHFGTLTTADRKALAPHHERLKALAAQADADLPQDALEAEIEGQR